MKRFVCREGTAMDLRHTLPFSTIYATFAPHLRQVCVTLDGALITRLIPVLRQHFSKTSTLSVLLFYFSVQISYFFPIYATTAPLSRHHGQESYHLAKSGLKQHLLMTSSLPGPIFFFFRPKLLFSLIWATFAPLLRHAYATLTPRLRHAYATLTPHLGQLCTTLTPCLTGC